MEKETLDDIYKSHMKDIYHYLLSLCRDHYLAEDIMQETFYRAYMYLEDCPAGKIKPWLFRVAHNAFVDFKRKDSRNTFKDRDFFKNLTDLKTPEDHYIVQEELMEIGKLIEGLPENYKQALLLSDFHGLSYKEGSEVMEVSLAYFKVLLFRARQKIRINSERNGGFE